MNTPINETGKTLRLREVELVFFCSAVIVFISAVLEHLISAPSSEKNYLQLSTVLLTLGYWTLSIRGLSLLIRGMGAQRAGGAEAGKNRLDIIVGGILKASSLILLADFMFRINRERAICFFITMVGYAWLGLIGLLVMHFYITRKSRGMH